MVSTPFVSQRKGGYALFYLKLRNAPEPVNINFIYFMYIQPIYTKMQDIFDQKVLCSECNVLTRKNCAVKDGFELRVLECPQCSKIIYHPGDLKEYDDFKRLKQRDFNVKLRMVGNSFCVSIPKELVDFHREFEREFNDLIRLSLEGRGKIGLFFIRRKDL
ncbi:hypothetical protein J4230_04745 [Candidatus Woesearchaeota archaeon]|nr:hypothetical protein [Candidatus Woesearchaeota archaeon]